MPTAGRPRPQPSPPLARRPQIHHPVAVLRDAGLSPRAKLAYAELATRAAEGRGPAAPWQLCPALVASESAVRRALRELETAGLARRERGGWRLQGGAANVPLRGER